MKGSQRRGTCQDLRDMWHIYLNPGTLNPLNPKFAAFWEMSSLWLGNLGKQGEVLPPAIDCPEQGSQGLCIVVL